MVRSEVEALIAEFAWRIDHQEGRGVEDLFVDDGVYRFDFGAMEGREAIAGFYAWRRKQPRVSRHLFCNLHIDALSETSAATTCVLSLHAGNGTAPLPLDPVMVADYHDTLHRGEDGIWRFQERRVELVFGTYPHLRATGG